MIVAPQKAATDMFAKNAAIFIFRVEMFRKTLWKVFVARMGSDANDAPRHARVRLSQTENKFRLKALQSRRSQFSAGEVFAPRDEGIRKHQT
jgi:predicted kinase